MKDFTKNWTLTPTEEFNTKITQELKIMKENSHIDKNTFDYLKPCREAWDQRAVKEPPTECRVQLLTLVLKHSNFTFNGEHFVQINGTAMGTKMAPSYANIFMGNLKNLSYNLHLTSHFPGFVS